jgi:cellulose synthase/poly-beta-1,6-N-acetylglucosamine synthase-like glycosyltransferase
MCIGSILYTYIGYPLLLTLLARMRRRPLLRSDATPTVTLLITAYNEEAVIAEKLENSLALEYPRDRLQILVAADGSDDRTAAIVGSFADRGVELSYSPPRRGKMAAINRAMPRVRGEIVVFSDANNAYVPSALRALVAPFADPQVGAVSGAKVIMRGDGALSESEGLYGRYESYIKRQETAIGSCSAAAGEILALRRELFEEPPERIINDDFYMAIRMIKRGYRVVYAPEARSYERISLSADDEIVRRTRIIAGRYQAIAMAPQLLPLRDPLATWQIVSHKFLRPLVPLAMIGAAASNLIAVARPARAGAARWRLPAPFGAILLLGQAIFYLLAWAGNRTERSGMASKILYLPTFLVNSNFAALLGLYRFLTGRQTTLWQRVQRRDRITHDTLTH